MDHTENESITLGEIMRHTLENVRNLSNIDTNRYINMLDSVSPNILGYPILTYDNFLQSYDDLISHIYTKLNPTERVILHKYKSLIQSIVSELFKQLNY